VRRPGDGRQEGREKREDPFGLRDRHPLWWAKEAESLGAGEICLNSIDADGTLDGYELDLTHLIATSVNIPVIASGGAGRKEHLLDVLTKAKADAALIASIVHYGTYTIAELKEYLSGNGVKVREVW